MYRKDFGGWNVKKLALEQSSSVRYFYEREIWWCSIGHNIGSEEDGKGDEFSRPVLILRKFSKELFYGLPLSTTHREGKYYVAIYIKGIEKKIILSQLRVFDAKRLINKIAQLSEEEYKNVLIKLVDLILDDRD